MKQAFLKMHLSILLAGFTGVFGKLITLNEGLLVWYRMLITAVLFFLFLVVSKKLRKIPFREVLKISGVGVLLSLHWLFFYGSIKASNVSIGVVCFSLIGFFTAIFEPLINRHRVSFRELLFSIITLLGIFLIFHFDTRYRTGIIIGVISSAFAALFTISNKNVGKDHNSSSMLLYEMISGFLFLSLLMPLYLHYFPVRTMLIEGMDIVYMLLLCVFCTILMFILQIQALKHISAFTFNLSFNLEPVYSIIIAMLFLGEAKELDASFYIGLALIILSVVLQTRVIIKEQKEANARIELKQ